MNRHRNWSCLALALVFLVLSSTAGEAQQRRRNRNGRRVAGPAETTTRQPRAARHEARVPIELAEAHRRNVETVVQRLLASGSLLPEQEYWTRIGLEKFLEAPSGAQGEVLSGWAGEISALERNRDLESRSPVATFRAVQPETDEVVPSVGRLTCFVGDALLINGRFVAVATYHNPFNGLGGVALACQLTPTSGYFFFGLDRSNVEVPIKMLYGCFNSPPGHWVFAAGLTNFGVQITVVDGFTGISKTYNNAAGSSFLPIIDQSTPFPCP